MKEQTKDYVESVIDDYFDWAIVNGCSGDELSDEDYINSIKEIIAEKYENHLYESDFEENTFLVDDYDVLAQDIKYGIRKKLKG
jgi:hypothetical protein